MPDFEPKFPDQTLGAESASSAQQAHEIPEIVSERTSFLKQESELELGQVIGKGDSSVAFDCRSKNGLALGVLKVSKMTEGIHKSEISTLRDLAGTPGIPSLLETYAQDSITIGLLLEKIEGSSLKDYVTAKKSHAVEVLMKIRKLIEDFHNRGYLMPHDWLKPDNWIIRDDGQPYLVDLGEPRKKKVDRQEAEFQMQSDLRGFHDLVDRYKEFADRKGRSALDELVYRDFLLSREGQSFKDRWES